MDEEKKQAEPKTAEETALELVQAGLGPFEALAGLISRCVRRNGYAAEARHVGGHRRPGAADAPAIPPLPPREAQDADKMGPRRPA